MASDNHKGIALQNEIMIKKESSDDTKRKDILKDVHILVSGQKFTLEMKNKFDDELKKKDSIVVFLKCCNVRYWLSTRNHVSFMVSFQLDSTLSFLFKDDDGDDKNDRVVQRKFAKFTRNRAYSSSDDNDNYIHYTLDVPLSNVYRHDWKVCDATSSLKQRGLVRGGGTMWLFLEYDTMDTCIVKCKVIYENDLVNPFRNDDNDDDHE
jgi:hypothetical protein